MDKDTALKLALEALEANFATWSAKTKAIPIIKEALAQPEQEPVAWELRAGKTDRVLIEITNNPQRAHDWKASLEEVVPLYTTPPQRKWVGLTDEQIGAILEDPSIAEKHQGNWLVLPYAYARAIEAKLREKNGG